MGVRVRMAKNPSILANAASVERFVAHPVITVDEPSSPRGARARKKPQERTAADWNRLLQAEAKRAERRQRRKLEDAHRLAPSLVIPEMTRNG